MEASVLSLLSEATQKLLKADSFDSIVKSFEDICQEDFNLEGFNIIRLNSISPFNWEKHDLENLSTIQLNQTILDETMNRLKVIGINQIEYREGLSEIVINKEQILFGVIGDPASDFYVVLLKLKTPNRKLLEFLFTHLQSASKLHLRYSKTQSLVYIDDLTGLYNARFLDEAVENEVRRCERFSTHFSLLFIDLDNFKMINDKFGHLAGSQVLRQMSDVFKSALREVDSVIRYGGDEFVILLLGANPSKALLAAERIRRQVEENRFMLDDGHHVTITASIGVATFPEHADSKKQLLKIADECMYKGKKFGKNKVVVFRPNEEDVLIEKTTKS